MSLETNSFKNRFPLGIPKEELIYDEGTVVGFESLTIETKREVNSLFAPVFNIRNISGVECFSFNFEEQIGFESLPASFKFDRDNAVKDIFDSLVEDLVIDNKWIRKLRQYVYGFVTKNNDHVEFFGSPYLGTHRVIYKTSDRKDWFSDIIDVDDVVLRDELIKCKWINEDFHVSSDVFNLSIVYLMYKVQNSNLPKGMKEEGLLNLVMMFHYRTMTSIMNHYYSYLVRKNVAEAAYNALSLKFDIKRYGSWNDLFKARAEFIIDPKTGIHFETFNKMNDDKKIVYMLNDMESRLKGVVNDYTAVLYKVKDTVDKVTTEDGKVLLDGMLVVKDIQKNVNMKRNYIANLLSNTTGFYNEEFANYSIKEMDRTPPDKFKQVLKDFPYQYSHKKGQKYVEFVDDVITHLFEYINENKIKETDIREVMVRMRGAYNSNKSTNPLLFKLRDTGDNIIKSMTGIRTRSTVSSMRTSLMLYIVLRTITMEYFK